MSRYFRYLPLVVDYYIDGKPYTISDITERNIMSKELQDDERLYMAYTIRDGDTPEILADKIYNNVNLYWVILLFNDIFDIEDDWPLDQPSFVRMLDRVYNDPDGIHHYESIATGAWVDSDHVDYDRLPITNREYEAQKNDEKRNIKILLPEYLDLVVQPHQRRNQ